MGCGGGGSIRGFSAFAGDREVSIRPFKLLFSIAIADLNNDGLPDLAVATTVVAGAPPHPGFVSVIPQNPQAPGTFFRGVHFATGTDPIAVAVGDLNGDGRLDLAVANNSSGNVSVLIQDPASPGKFLQAVNLRTGGYPSGIAIGDLNGDGRPDIAVATGRRSVSILFQNSSGPPGTFLAPATIPVRGGSAAVAIGDLNGDGAADLVVLAGVVSVLLQDPQNPGTFLARKDYRAGQQPIAVRIGDLNGDGVPDLAVANLGSPSNPGSANVSVLLQDITHRGNFLARTNYGTGARSEDVAIGDLNADNRADLVVANSGTLSTTGSVSVLLQKPPKAGRLSFGRKNYAGKSGPLSVAIGDLNGDGRPDIAVADGNSATILFQKPAAPGTFFPPVNVGN